LCFVTVTFKQGLVLYNTTNVITTLKKHVNANHSIIVKMFEEEVNRSLKGEVEKQPTKKRLNPYRSAIVFFFFCCQISFPKSSKEIEFLQPINL
jgi:hypothetical protein